MAKKRLKKGLFITFEGPEGCGKSTHARKIFSFLKRQGYPCILTREPGGTAVGEKIRAILLDTRNKEIPPRTEVLLFETARCQLLHEVIIPALRKRYIVLSDRFSDSTVVYQGFAGAVPLKEIAAVDTVATEGIKPDLTILLDVDTETGFRRALKKRRRDRMEEKSARFHRRVRRGYLKLAERESKRIRLVKVREDRNETHRLVREEVLRCLSKRS